MNSNVYRWCTVPQCNNTSIKTPNKLFINVPMKKKVRNTWLNLARRDPAAISSKSVIYFCEDHFDVRLSNGYVCRCLQTLFLFQLPNDMENYIQYHVMGSVAQVRMKSGCNPRRFECQPDRRKRASNSIERQYVIKKQRKILIEDSEKDLAEKITSTKYLDAAGSSFENPDVLATEEQHEGLTTYPKLADKSIQVHTVHKFRSKAVQTEIKLRNQLTSPIKPECSSISTSPFKVESCGISKSKTSKASKRIFPIEDQIDSDISYTPSMSHESSPSIQSLQFKSTSDCSELTEEIKKEEASDIVKYTLLKIMRNPRSYIGLPESCCYLINLIEEHTKIPTNHILLCLKKIRLNNPFKQLADGFSINTSYASKIFFKNIPIIASVMKPFIVSLDKNLTKRTLPMAFRHKFHHTSCIIDCLEIEIQKPSQSVNQAMSWSDYKKANTIKYLVSCTPNGLVNYISPGYGGRVTDTCLVESCGFIKCLQPGMCVMENIQLVRPPSIITGAKLSKCEVKETKQIASLRIHVERVIRRLREFNMLKPHACLNTNFVKILDDVIVIACAFINLQDSLIK